MEILIFWLLLCFVPVFVATQKGNSGLTIFIVSLILSPVIGLVIALIQKPSPAHSAASVAPPTPVSALGVADELAKPTVLRDSGTITQAEFDRQRAILLPPAPTWGPHSQARAGMVCGFCLKPVSPAWKGKCNHCRTKYTEIAPKLAA